MARPRRNLLPGLGRASVLYLLALILVIFGLWIPDTFLTQATFKIVLGDQVVIGILGLAVLVPLSAGAFDLSCGAMLAFSLVIMSWFQAESLDPPAAADPRPRRLRRRAGSCPGWSSSSSTSTRSSPRSA